MLALNRRYRGKDYATDVLSFSYGDNQAGVTADSQTGGNEPDAPYLGDVVISPEVACRQALGRGISPEREMRRLLVHGILHLLGYDHESDQGEMNRLQALLLRRRALRLGDPIIRVLANRRLKRRESSRLWRSDTRPGMTPSEWSGTSVPGKGID